MKTLFTLKLGLKVIIVVAVVLLFAVSCSAATQGVTSFSVNDGRRDTCLPPPNPTVLVLDGQSDHALEVTGGGAMEVKGNLVVNSRSWKGGFLAENVLVKADAVSMTGGYDVQGNARWLTDHLDTGRKPSPDPMSRLPEPAIDQQVLRSESKVRLSSGAWILKPGLYRGGISIGGNTAAVLEPGVYYVEGGGFSVTDQATVMATGVFIFNLARTVNDRVEITTHGNMTLSAPESGVWSGVAMFQNRTAEARVQIAASNRLNLNGTFYAPSAPIEIVGQSEDAYLGAQFISRSFAVHGNGALHLDWDGSVTVTCEAY